MTPEQKQQPTLGNAPGPDPRERLTQEILLEIKHLRALSNRGLWAMSLFIMICMMAWRDFPFLPLPSAVVAKLGAPPPPYIISCVLLFYTFFAILLSLLRMTTGIEHKSSFSHVGYLTCFFLFYYFAMALDDNFWAVLGAGVTIFSIESYRIWTFCRDGLTRKFEHLDYVKRTGRLPPEDD